MKKQKTTEIVILEKHIKKCKYKIKKLSGERSIAKVEKQASVERIIRWSNFIVYLLYPGLTVRQFQIFACDEIAAGEYILAADPNIRCYDQQWYTFVYGTSFLLM